MTARELLEAEIETLEGRLIGLRNSIEKIDRRIKPLQIQRRDLDARCDHVERELGRRRAALEELVAVVDGLGL